MIFPNIIPNQGAIETPTLTIKVNGSEIPNTYQVASVIVTRVVNKISFAELIIYDGDPAEGNFEISSSSEFIPNTPIEVHAGYQRQETKIFEGIVVNHCIKIFRDKPSFLKIYCKHEAEKMTVQRNVNYFYDSTDSQIINNVLRGAGLSSRTSVDTTTFLHKELIQYYATDWDFILTRAEANGLYVYTEDGAINITKPDIAQAPVLSVLYGATILDFEAEMESRNQFSGVNASSWNPANQQMVQVSSSPPLAISPGDISTNDLSGTIGLSAFDLRHAGQIKDTELQSWADAQIPKSHLSKIRGRVRIQGFADVLPGQLIDLGGLGDRFNGTAWVSGVRHEINLQNWETDISFGLNPDWHAEQYENVQSMPAEGLIPAVKGLQIGIVTKLEQDPEGEHRVRVRIPMIDATGEGIWARIACLDAGDQRGSFFRPEINDEVVLGFFDDDPRNPIILGQLNSSAKPAPIQALDTNHIKGFYTRDQIKLEFDDEKKSVTIETPGGNKAVWDDTEQSIVIEDQHGNKITLDQNGITIDSPKEIKIKAGTNLNVESSANTEIKASAQLKASGSAGAEFSSTGTNTIKGAMVQIN